MDFNEYYMTGEENPEEVLELDKKVNSSFKTEINESLIAVIFKTLRTSMKVTKLGGYLYFKWELIGTRSIFTFRLKQDVFSDFVDWLVSIKDEAKTGGGEQS